MPQAGEGRESVPVLLVTGALGAGKTTLINTMLQGAHGLALAAVVNDFGSINIDETILSAAGQPIYGLKNGCICCSLQGDLLRTLRLILSGPARLDGIVIEASGVSDPRGIAEALFDPLLCDVVRLDAVATVVDAEEHDPQDALWIAQVRAADIVMLSKTARAGPQRAASLRAKMAAMKKALVFEADDGSEILAKLLLGGFPHRPEEHRHGRAARMAEEQFACLEWSAESPVSRVLFQAAVQSFSSQLLRAKGYVAFAELPGRSYLFQLVGTRASLVPAAVPIAGAQLVFIGRAGVFDLPAARTMLDRLRTASGAEPAKAE